MLIKARSLRKECLKRSLTFTINKCFPKVIFKCASRDETWITTPIIDNYIKINKMGYAHSIEIWDKKILIGGLYGVSVGSVFFAESMFSEYKNGSKFAMIALMFILVKNNFLLLDVQFMTKHLQTMGAKEVPKDIFIEKLKIAKIKEAKFQSSKWIGLDSKILETLAN